MSPFDVSRRSGVWSVTIPLMFIVGLALSVVSSVESAGPARPRVIVLSDFPPLDVIPVGAGHGPADRRSDPDDIQSMVRFLLYANEFHVEGLLASPATMANVARKQHVLDILDLYDQVDENLRRHDPRYPTAEALRAVTWEGRDGTWGKPASDVIGEGRDSAASEAVIRLVDQPDARPIWALVWGGRMMQMASPGIRKRNW